MNQFGRKDHGHESSGGGRSGGRPSPRTDHQSEKGGWGSEYGTELRNLSEISAKRIVEISEEVGKHLSRKGIDLKINQIRRFLDETRQIESELTSGQFSPDRIVLLRPKLAYAAGRENKVKDLMNVLDPAIQSAADSAANFGKLLRLIEGIVAYHRYFDGTN